MTGEAAMDREGCCATIIVRDGEVIGEGWNNVAETCDAIAHLMALARPGRARHIRGVVNNERR